MIGGLFTLILLALAGCSVLRSGRDAGAGAVAYGARIAALQTARTGALLGKGTYKGSRKAVTWTGDRTVDGTQATLDFLGLGERQVPPDVLERLPDQMLDTLTALQFVPALGQTERVVIASPDSRWEGELFYRAPVERPLEVQLDGPVELIVISMVCFPAGPASPLEKATYTVLVREDESNLGEVRFETLPNNQNGIYGQAGVRVSYPGVFVVKTLPGVHSYKFSVRSESGAGTALCAFFLPRYDRGSAVPAPPAGTGR
ncbi:hypothetical protein LLH00_05645 [bacterium]|nr:hypothetical protein [bacterium]